MAPRLVPGICCLLISLAICPLNAIPAEQVRQKDKQPRQRLEYTVQKGDSLAEIAERFNVSIKDLQRWNRAKTKDPRHLKVGTSLRIKTRIPVRTKRKTWYIVKKGDSIRRIARKLNVTEEHLRAMNHLKKDLIRPGDKIAFLVRGPEKKSESVGRPYDGRLVNGEKLPKGPGYSYGGRRNVYGTNETVTLLVECFGEQVKKYPDGPRIVVGNLSQKKGGKFGPHASHQSGRDVDLGYMHKKGKQPVTQLMRTTPKNLDPRRTWHLLQCFIDSGQVHYMFMAHSLQKALYEHLLKRRFKKKYLDKLFQYPRKSGGGGIIQHSSGHADHVHIRFKCPKGDKRCQD
jgi:LysM repeat protein